jgi:hypothetical protein
VLTLGISIDKSDSPGENRTTTRSNITKTEAGGTATLVRR